VFWHPIIVTSEPSLFLFITLISINPEGHMLPVINTPAFQSIVEEKTAGCKKAKENFLTTLKNHPGNDACFDRVNDYIQNIFEIIRRCSAEPQATALFGDRVSTVIILTPSKATDYSLESTPISEASPQSDPESIDPINSYTKTVIKMTLYSVFHVLFERNFSLARELLMSSPNCKVKIDCKPLTGDMDYSDVYISIPFLL